MSIILVHPFKNKLPNIDELFNVKNGNPTVQTVDSFCNRVIGLAQKYDQSVMASNDFKGNALEAFAEFLIKANETDNRIGIYGYTPTDASDDYGVDGVGQGENQNPATVQIKFRTGDYVLTDRHDQLTAFMSQSQNRYGVKLTDTKNMLIITTALTVEDRVLENMLMGKVRVLNREALREMLDNRPEWWSRFYESMKASVTPKQEYSVKTLRPHQSEAVEAVMNCKEKLGKVVLPTGVGKTMIEAEIICRTIASHQDDDCSVVIKVNSPRILLCLQLYKEVFMYLQPRKVKARYVNFNSGSSDEKWVAEEMKKNDEVYREMICTTSPSEVQEAYVKACAERIPLIVFSTYNSSVRFAESGLVPCLTLHDEAHNLVSGEFNKAADRNVCPTEASLFFTATEKVTDSPEDLGMNNPDIFGNMLYTKSPRQMIEIGEMVPPRMHYVTPREGIVYDLSKVDNDIAALALSIFDAFTAHKKRIKENSCSPCSIGAKVLVVCSGQKELKGMMDPAVQAIEEHINEAVKKIFKNIVFETLRKQHPDIHLFALSSNYGIYNDGEFIPAPVNNSKKNELLRKINAMGSEENAIIFHVDMIGEGIDVPGITGVMPFRNCELTKFVQNVGRSARLHPEDRRKLYAGEIHPNKHDREVEKKWIKPYCWVIIPSFLENAEGFKGRFTEIIQELRNNYGYVPRQDTLIDNVKGIEDDDPIDTVNEKNKRSPHSHSGIYEFDHEFEQLSVCEQVELNSVINGCQSDFLSQLNAIANGTNLLNPEGVVFFLKARGLSATMKITGGVSVLLPGSEFRQNGVSSLKRYYQIARQEIVTAGSVKDGRTVVEIPCSTPSFAASIALGATVNGNDVWVDGQGISIAKYGV